MHDKTQYKLLALDIDGTLVPEHTNCVSTALQEAVAQAKERVAITLVSARAWKDQQIIVKTLNLCNNYHVIENGTKVINPLGKVEYSRYIPYGEAQHIYDVTQGWCDSVGFCIEGKWMLSLSHVSKNPITTLSLITPWEKAEIVSTLLEKLPQKYSITVGNHWSEPNLAVVLVSHRNASKGYGLHYVQQKLGISLKETIAVGDGASDIPMMNYAAVRVAMGNAEQKMKDVASYIAPTVQEDGVVTVINKFIFLNEVK